MNNKNSDIIKELKLKTENKYEMEKWISLLNQRIKPKRIEFFISNANYVKSTDIFNFKNQSKIYVSLCNLEYILLKNKMKIIFTIYKSKYLNLIPNETVDERDSII